MSVNSELHIQMQDDLLNTYSKYENGDLNALDVLIQFRKEKAEFEKSLEIIKSFEDDFFSNIETEIQNYPDGYNGYEIQVRNGGKTFDYSHIKEWSDIENQKKEIENKYRGAFESSRNGLLSVTGEGEELELPIPKYRKSSIILKPKK